MESIYFPQVKAVTIKFSDKAYITGPQIYFDKLTLINHLQNNMNCFGHVVPS